VSDPWDFAAENGEGPFAATVVAAQEKAIALKLDNPLSFKGTVFDHLVATARHVDKELSNLSRNAIPVNLTPITPRAAGSAQTNVLFAAAEDWRGWHLTGGLRTD